MGFCSSTRQTFLNRLLPQDGLVVDGDIVLLVPFKDKRLSSELRSVVWDVDFGLGLLLLAGLVNLDLLGGDMSAVASLPSLSISPSSSSQEEAETPSEWMGRAGHHDWLGVLSQGVVWMFCLLVWIQFHGIGNDSIAAEICQRKRRKEM